MSRYLLIDPDGETIVAVLSMNESDALLNVRPGQTLFAIAPDEDSGTVIDNASVKFAGGAIVTIAGGTTPAQFADLTLQEVTPPE